MDKYLQSFYQADVEESRNLRPFVVKASINAPYVGDWKSVVYGYDHAHVTRQVEQTFGDALVYIRTIYDAETGE